MLLIGYQLSKRYREKTTAAQNKAASEKTNLAFGEASTYRFMVPVLSHGAIGAMRRRRHVVPLVLGFYRYNSVLISGRGIQQILQ